MPSAITRCELIWYVPDLGPSSSAALAQEGVAERVVDAYVARSHLTCCSFQLGFYIDVDGAAWSDEGTVDEPRMTWSWITALERLLGGETRTGVWPWEESSLGLERDGDVVTMEDVHPAGDIVMRRVEVSLNELAARMHAELVSMATVIRAVRAEASARLDAENGDSAKLETILRELPGEDEHGLPAIERLGRALGH